MAANIVIIDTAFATIKVKKYSNASSVDRNSIKLKEFLQELSNMLSVQNLFQTCLCYVHGSNFKTIHS